jgi:valyl-tRNA synthetase
MVAASVVVPDAALRVPFSERRELIEALARVEPLSIVASTGEVESEGAAVAVLADATVIVPLGGLVDLEAERAKLRRETTEVEEYIANLEAQIAKARGRAPERVVAGMEEKLTAARNRLDGLRARLAELGD